MLRATTNQPGQPTEPPQESPPGNPRPEVPPPMQDPATPNQPQELPGYTPEELPVRNPDEPSTPKPATDSKAPSIASAMTFRVECVNSRQLNAA